MKQIYTILLVLLLSQFSFAQFGAEQIIIDNNIDGRVEVFSADIDNDGDFDLIFSSNGIKWMENLDGNGTFGSFIPIVYTAGDSNFYIDDIDGDNDIDIIYETTVQFPSTIAWLENNGSGVFGTPNSTFSNNEYFITSIKTADLDGDGDKDVIVSYFGSGADWFENTNGLGSFGGANSIHFSYNIDGTLNTSDFDSDGDIDVATVVNAGGKTIRIYKNNNDSGVFELHQNLNFITTAAAQVKSLEPVDLDGDGDEDLLFSTIQNSLTGWYENTDGQGNFSEAIILAGSPFGTDSLPSDIDNDGDFDIIVLGYNEIGWIENLGSGIFADIQVILNISNPSTTLNSLEVFDINNDGCKDIVLGSFDNSKVSWFENSCTLLSTSNYNLEVFSIYPNPTSGKLKILSKTSINSISIFDINGRLLKSEKLSNQQLEHQLDVTNLYQGIYFLEIQSGKSIQKKKFIKR